MLLSSLNLILNDYQFHISSVFEKISIAGALSAFKSNSDAIIFTSKKSFEDIKITFRSCNKTYQFILSDLCTKRLLFQRITHEMK